MTRILRTLAALAAALVLALVAAPALALAKEGEPQVTEAQCYEVMDQDGNVLAAHDADRQMAPASITKIMTAMVALDSGKPMDDKCTITDLTYTDGAQLAGYTSADTPTFRQLMMAMLVYSANDAAYNVALNVAGSEDAFVDLMNQKAQQLGMTHTHFENPHGLEEDGHYSCARDLVTMGRYALENYPFIRQTVLKRSTVAHVNGSEITLPSTDDLMDTYPGLCGIKTGAVESGTAFLGACKRHGLALFSCVLGCSTHEGRFTDTERLMNWALDACDEYHLARPSWIIRVAPSATDFTHKLVVRTAWASGGYAWPSEKVVSSQTMLRPGRLAEPGQAYGHMRYTAGDRLVCSTVYQASERACSLPSVNVFALPFFASPEQLGALYQ